MSTEPAAEPKVLIRVQGSTGRLTLNRPRAINALDHDMVQRIHHALESWAQDPAITQVLIDGAGDRGLCAGGDIVSIYQDARNAGTKSLDFWRDEYTLNAAIANFPKPYIAIMDGIVMGGGVGISAHGNTRVVTERSTIAMPETGIGFIPDVGGTYLLARAPGELGTHLGLTGARMDAGDAIAAGFADHFVPSRHVDGFVEAVVRDGVQAAIAQYADQPPESPLLAERAWIDAAYQTNTAQQILDALADMNTPAAQRETQLLHSKSPTAVTVTLRSVRLARDATSLESVLNQEFRASNAALRSHDLREGIRAQVIDKDRDPHWSPETLADVDDGVVQTYFAPVGHELGLTTNNQGVNR